MQYSFEVEKVIALVIAFLLGTTTRIFLDLRLGLWVIRLFHWIPNGITRRIFRNDPPNLSGQWECIWSHGGSEQYKNETDRYSQPKLLQLDKYCYAKFIFKGRKYEMLGRIHGTFMVGEWFETVDKYGYFGAFEIKIINSNEMTGIWIGHSKEKSIIRCDKFEWKKVK